MNTEALSAGDCELIEVARRTADTLYLENVHKVASAVRTRTGHVFAGINIATRMPFADVCGEVAALSAMVGAGHRDPGIIVAVRRKLDVHDLMPPCGRCRELISDFDLDTWVIIGTLEQPRKVRVSELLPCKIW